MGTTSAAGSRDACDVLVIGNVLSMLYGRKGDGYKNVMYRATRDRYSVFLVFWGSFSCMGIWIFRLCRLGGWGEDGGL